MMSTKVNLAVILLSGELPKKDLIMQKFLDFFKKKLKSNIKWCELQLFFWWNLVKTILKGNCNQAVESPEA